MEQLTQRLNGLLSEAERMTRDVIRVYQGGSNAERRGSAKRRAEAGAWLASADALAGALLPDAESTHRRFIARAAGDGPTDDFEEQMWSVAAVLRALLVDLDHGLFRSVADQATAIVYDDLLDHAEEYLAAEDVAVAGVVAGVAFEDVMRRVRAMHSIEPNNIKIDELIAMLVKKGVMLDIEAKRARAAAGLRTSATHARWDEFGKGDVEACIHFTRDFVAKAFGS